MTYSGCLLSTLKSPSFWEFPSDTLYRCQSLLQCFRDLDVAPIISLVYNEVELASWLTNNHSQTIAICGDAGADPGFLIGGFYLFKCKARAKILKPRPFSYVFASSQSQFTAATNLWISNLAKVSESTFKHDFTG